MNSFSNRLLELSKRALLNEEQIIKEEKNYQDELFSDAPVKKLIGIRENITWLQRKQWLFNGAIQMRMNRMAVEV